MKRFSVGLVLMLLCTFSIFAQNKVITVSGRVVESDTKEPAAQATVQLLSLPDSAYAAGIASSNQGWFTLPKVRKEEVSTFITSPCITRHNIPPKTNKNVKKMALRTAEFRICSVSRLSFLLNAKIINKHPAIINNFVHSL